MTRGWKASNTDEHQINPREVEALIKRREKFVISRGSCIRGLSKHICPFLCVRYLLANHVDQKKAQFRSVRSTVAAASAGHANGTLQIVPKTDLENAWHSEFAVDFNSN